MITLIHEDIYTYVDPITEVTDVKTSANSFTFLNDATGQTSDLGIFTIEVISGSYTKATVASGGKTATFNVAMSVGTKITLDFRNLYFSNGTTLLFADVIPILTDNTTSNIVITMTGSGSTKITRVYEKAQENNNDILFVESISVDTTIERPKKTFLSGKEKTIKSEKKTHSFSINGLWSQAELSKFTDKFRLRLVDEVGTKIDTLAGCLKNSVGKSSSSNGDLTFTISGSCENIF